MTAQTSKTGMSFEAPNMLSYHSTWDDADYEPQVPTRNRRFARLSNTVLARLGALRERMTARRELGAMSDRELADIGINRYDVNRVFDPAFLNEYDSRRG